MRTRAFTGVGRSFKGAGIFKARVFEYPSSSNPDKTYETVLWSDQTLSCNCPGWTRRVASDGTRDCKHLKKVEWALNIERKANVPITGRPQPIVPFSPVACEDAPTGRRRLFLED